MNSMARRETSVRRSQRYTVTSSLIPESEEDADMYLKNKLWEEEKEVKLQAERERKAELEMEECSFAPNIRNYIDNRSKFMRRCSPEPR